MFKTCTCLSDTIAIYFVSVLMRATHAPIYADTCLSELNDARPPDPQASVQMESEELCVKPATHHLEQQ